MSADCVFRLKMEGAESLETQRISPGLPQSRAHDHLRDVLVANLVVRGQSALHIGVGGDCHGAVLEREFNNALQRQRFCRLSTKTTCKDHGNQ